MKKEDVFFCSRGGCGEDVLYIMKHKSGLDSRVLFVCQEHLDDYKTTKYANFSFADYAVLHVPNCYHCKTCKCGEK